MLTIKKMILCIALNLVLATFSGFAAPRLIVPPEGVAFGEISAGEAAEKAIELRFLIHSAQVRYISRFSR